ncbi:MAG TPA: homoserine kinase [Acidimicrobiales bacterium]|nr:homoserine kinase [Acidimicrobiales bacterium]
MRARAPASSANLGPGFDTLALALSLWVEVEMEPAGTLSITASGEGGELPVDASHLAARVARDVLGHDRVSIRVHSAIPVGRGLGSSAALAAAAAGAAGADHPTAHAVAVRFDGHPENAAASVYGGLVAASLIGAEPVVESLDLDPDLSFVVVVPDRHLATEDARRALPSTVSHADARFNLGRLPLLLAGLADHRRLRPEAAEDRLHQPYREALFPEAAPLMAGLLASGALAACWSGAGPTILGMVPSAGAADLRRRGEDLLAELSLPGRCLVLEADRAGLVVEDG